MNLTQFSMLHFTLECTAQLHTDWHVSRSEAATIEKNIFQVEFAYITHNDCETLSFLEKILYEYEY